MLLSWLFLLVGTSQVIEQRVSYAMGLTCLAILGRCHLAAVARMRKTRGIVGVRVGCCVVSPGGDKRVETSDTSCRQDKDA